MRKRAKEYGTRKAIEGIDGAGRRAVAIEDVVTTAGAPAVGRRHLRDAGATGDVTVSAIDRAEGGEAALAAIGVGLRSLVSRSVLEGQSS